MFSTFVATLEGRAQFMALIAGRTNIDPSLRQQMTGRNAVRVRGGQVLSRRALPAKAIARELSTANLDLAALAIAFAGRLQEVDSIAFTEAQAVAYADALQNEMPRNHRELYSVSRDIFLSGRQYVDLFNRTFAEVFGAHEGTGRYQDLAPAAHTAVAGMR
jgi:hypothetical protein